MQASAVTGSAGDPPAREFTSDPPAIRAPFAPRSPRPPTVIPMALTHWRTPFRSRTPHLPRSEATSTGTGGDTGSTCPGGDGVPQSSVAARTLHGMGGCDRFAADTLGPSATGGATIDCGRSLHTG